MVKWAVRATWVVAVVSLVALIGDALPAGWLWDLDDGGTQGLVRCVAVVTWVAALLQLTAKLPAHEVWQSGYEAGRRAAAEQLRSRLGSKV